MTGLKFFPNNAKHVPLCPIIRYELLCWLHIIAIIKNLTMSILERIATTNNGTILEAIIKFVTSVEEYRRTSKGNFRHPLPDLLLLAILCKLDGRTHYADYVSFGKKCQVRLQNLFGILSKGVPSISTFSRMFQGIEHEGMSDKLKEFADRFRRLLADNELKIISIDGKATRGTTNENGRNPDILSAFDVNTGITLATEMCEKKSNELKAAPKLLAKVPLKGNIFTMDAMFNHREVIDPIIEGGGFFVIELKANQKDLFYNSSDRIKTTHSISLHSEEATLEHGRIEERFTRVFRAEDLDVDPTKWSCVLRIIEVIVKTTDKRTNKETADRRLYISNLDVPADVIGFIIRQHWRIEINHWHLDRNFKQDQIKRKNDVAARNLDALLRLSMSSISIWKNLRRKNSDRNKGVAEILRMLRGSLTSIVKFLMQK